MSDPLIETWQINDRVNAFFLAGLPRGALDVVPATGGRSVGQILAHIHNVRLMWLEVSGLPVPKGVVKLDRDERLTTAVLAKALKASSAAMTSLIEASIAAGGRVKNFKPHVHAFVGYLVAHEAQHRGQILVALKANGTPVDKKIAYGIWEWGVR